MKRPVLRSSLRVVRDGDRGVLLVTDEQTRVLRGRAFAEVVALLDGIRTEEEIVTELAGVLPPTEAYYALFVLERDGHLREASPRVSSRTAASWERAGLDPAEQPELLRASRILWKPMLPGIGEAIREALVSLPVNLTEEVDDPVDCAVVVARDERDSALLEWNRTSRARKLPWLLVINEEPDLLWGPWFRPGEPGCYACLHHFMQQHHPARDFAEQVEGRSFPLRHGGSEQTDRLLGALVAREVERFLGRGTPLPSGRLRSFSVRPEELRTHAFQPLPECAVCGDPAKVRRNPEVTLARGARACAEANGWRTVTSEETWEALRDRVDRLCGIVDEVVPVHREPGLLAVYGAGHNRAVPLRELKDFLQGLRARSSGKGRTEAQARAGALCEAVERYSGTARPYDARERASFAAMKSRYGRAVLHPNDVLLFSQRQFACRDEWNRAGSRFNVVPEPLPEDCPIDWSPLWSLTRQEVGFLPTQFLYYEPKFRMFEEGFYAIGCSNGCASGNTREEAILQGSYELIERDATALWWYNRLSLPEIDLSSFSDPWFLRCRDYYEREWGRELWALELGSDLGFPVVAALARRIDGVTERILLGLGCHHDPAVALQRAITELHQMVTVVDQPPERRAGRSLGEESELVSWLENATLRSDPYLAPDPAVPLRRAEDLTSVQPQDLVEAIELVRARVEAKHMEMLVLDQTRPEAGLPVVKVVIPGLRHFWARFGPGRLYDIPVQEGWLAAPLREEELNPTPFFL